MKIEVLGTGCRKCERLLRVTRESLVEADVEAELVKVERLDEILRYGVMMTPGLVIAGEVKAAGAVPRAAEIVAWIRAAAERE